MALARNAKTTKTTFHCHRSQRHRNPCKLSETLRATGFKGDHPAGPAHSLSPISSLPDGRQHIFRPGKLICLEHWLIENYFQTCSKFTKFHVYYIYRDITLCILHNMTKTAVGQLVFLGSHGHDVGPSYNGTLGAQDFWNVWWCRISSIPSTPYHSVIDS